MAEKVSKERSDQGEQSSTEQSTKQEGQVDIQREMKTILQEMNIVKEWLANVQTKIMKICENQRDVPPHQRPENRVEPLPEL